jgi:hypothetical protein
MKNKKIVNYFIFNGKSWEWVYLDLLQWSILKKKIIVEG